jgi:hypothetical protein
MLFNSYFNLNKNTNNKSNNSNKNIIYIYNVFNMFVNINDTILNNNFLNIIKSNYKFNFVNKQYLYIIKRKKILIKWKNKLLFNRNKNIINKYNILSMSLKKIFTSTPKVKHTNNNIYILLFMFNRNRIYLKKVLKKLKFIIIKRKLIKEKEIDLQIYMYNILHLKIILKKTLNNKNIIIFLKKYFLTKTYLDNFKLNNLNLSNLKKIIYKVYLKNIYINIVNINYVYMENNIFINALINKLNDRKKKALRILKQGLKLIKIAQLDPNFLKEKKKKIKDNMKIDNYKYINHIYSYLEDKYNTLFKYMKNIHIIGVSLEAKGRLTRRMTASRSLHKFRYKGNLKNIYSFNFGLPISLNLGSIRSNITKNKKDGKNKNGSFSILSLINTY